MLELFERASFYLKKSYPYFEFPILKDDYGYTVLDYCFYPELE